MSAQAWHRPGSSLCMPWVVTEAAKALQMLGAEQPVSCVTRTLQGCVVSTVLTSDALHRQLPPPSSSCYHSNVWELQSWTKTPLNYLKWSNSTASALTALLSLQMDILYLAVANVSIWALIFSWGAASILVSAGGQTATAGEPPGINPPLASPEPLESAEGSHSPWRASGRGLLAGNSFSSGLECV